MSAIFNNTQHSSGYSVGGNTLGRLFITVLSLMLIGYNAVHLHDYALVMFVNADTWWLKEIAIRVAAVGLAFLEIVIGGVFVYLYRTRESTLNGGLILTAFLALVVASMAVIAGNGSQQSKADVKTNSINAHDSSMLSINSLIIGAQSELDLSLRLANQIKDPNQRAIEKDRARLNYQNTIARLNTQKASMQTERPIEPIENGSTFHYVAITLFSILCSFGALFLSGYSAAFLKPLVAIPAFTLVSKLRHAWDSDGSDFKTVQHKVSPLGGMLSGFIKADKALPQKVEKEQLTSSGSGTTNNRPTPLDTSSGRSELSGVRTPNNTAGSTAKVEYSENHYQAIRAAVLSTDITPTVRPVKSMLVSQNVKFVDDAARQQKANEILDQLKGETVLIDNPEFGKSGQIVAKYVLNPGYQATKQKGDDIEVTCPKCNEVGLIEKSVLQKSEGRIRCGCGDVYKVKVQAA